MKPVSELINKHEGQCVWIFATGPSLDYVDDAQIIGPRIFLNRTAFVMPTSPGESYWMACDDSWGMGVPGPWQETLDKVRNGTAGFAGVFRDPLMAGNKLVPAPDGANIYHFKGEKSLTPHLLKMDREQLALTNNLYQYCGTSAPAVHLAWFMGAASVNLIGCDGTDGYAERLSPFYKKKKRGGLGYKMARASAANVINALNIEIKEANAKV